MNPKQVTEMGSSFASMIVANQGNPDYQQGVYDAAYKFAILEARKNVKFQHDFFMRYIENRSGFVPRSTVIDV